MIVLKIILLVFLYLILFLIGLLLLLLISPIRGRVDFSTTSLYVKGSYLFGLIRVYYVEKKLRVRFLWFTIIDGQEETEEEEETVETKEKAEKENKKKNKFKKPSKEVIVYTLNLIKKLIKIIAPKEAKLHLTLGIDEPYYIEMMHIMSLLFFMPLNNIRNYDFKFIPVHDDIVMDYKGGAAIRFSIMNLLLPCLRYIIRKPIRDYFNIRLFKRKPD